MRKYELVLIFSPKSREEKRKKVIGEIEKIIKKGKGKVEKVTPWGKKKFAYLIEKEKEGWYYLILFSTEVENLSQIEKELKLKEEILRFLIIRRG